MKSPPEGSVIKLEQAPTVELIAELQARYPSVIVAIRDTTLRERTTDNTIWMNFESDEDEDSLARALSEWGTRRLDDRKRTP